MTLVGDLTQTNRRSCQLRALEASAEAMANRYSQTPRQPAARYGRRSLRRRISEEQVSELSKPSWARPCRAPTFYPGARAMATKKSAVEQTHSLRS